ncbi:MAG: hypothetical protein SGPRY_012853, partial [Prymnesium sp.]
SWLIELEGGGWCVDPSACATRAALDAHSYKLRRQVFLPGGIISGNPVVNPDFHGFHRAVFKYCDGGSWTGERESPLLVRSRKVWLRGRSVLLAQLRYLLRFGFGSARELLLVGHSAGGLAAQLHADWIRGQLGSQIKKYKVVNSAGFFAQSRGGCEREVDCPWLRAMRAMVELHHSTSSFHPSCLSRVGWRCVFANESATSMATPAFLLMSG